MTKRKGITESQTTGRLLDRGRKRKNTWGSFTNRFWIRDCGGGPVAGGVGKKEGQEGLEGKNEVVLTQQTKGGQKQENTE